MNAFAFALVIYGLTVYVAHRVLDKGVVREPRVSPFTHEATLLIAAFGWPVFLTVASLQYLHSGEKS